MASITVRQVMDRVRQQLGSSWKDSEIDTLYTGDPDTPVTGIATSFTPSIQVLDKAIASGLNLIVTQQPAYYMAERPHASTAPDVVVENLGNDPAYLFKKDLIERHKLAVWRLYENWNARAADMQLLGLAKALGWDRYHRKSATAPVEIYTAQNKYFYLPEDSLKNKVAEIVAKLNDPAIRVIGDPATRITKASISNGMFKIGELQEILKDPEVDLIVIAEAIEWESCEYFRDMLTWKGKNRAMILLGREPSEDPGYGEMAAWMKTFIPEVPIQWIPAGTPFWIPG
jgi:putative NIF3 family GTP cyclohydrolase 1 type 2